MFTVHFTFCRSFAKHSLNFSIPPFLFSGNRNTQLTYNLRHETCLRWVIHHSEHLVNFSLCHCLVMLLQSPIHLENLQDGAFMTLTISCLYTKLPMLSSMFTLSFVFWFYLTTWCTTEAHEPHQHLNASPLKTSQIGLSSALKCNNYVK